MGELTRAERNIQWIEKHCRVPEGKFAAQPVVLREFQREAIREIYDGQTRMGIISFGRKNAKTALAGMLTLLHLVGPEAQVNSQLYSAAQSRDQAAVLFGLASKIVRMSPTLQDFVRIVDSSKKLICEELGTEYVALSADASTNFGKSPIFVVHDELGQVRGPHSQLFEALETAVGAHEHPLSIVISTQAPTDGDLLSVLIDDAMQNEDPETKLVLWSASEEIDPFSREAQEQANPALGDFLNENEVARQAEKARRMPSRESAYRNLVLNQRVSQDSPFVARTTWNESEGVIDEAAFEDGPVFGGLDLSERNDLTALSLVAQGRDGVWNEKTWFWAPREGIEERAQRDRTPYDSWWRKGYLEATPGASVDYSFVAHKLLELWHVYPIAALAFDRWHIESLRKEMAHLEGDDYPLVEFGQGYKSMAPALDFLEGEILNGRFRQSGNPVLKMCAANAIATKDPVGNRKLDKSKITGRIDGMVALTMAMGQAAQQQPVKRRASIYEQGVL